MTKGRMTLTERIAKKKINESLQNDAENNLINSVENNNSANRSNSSTSREAPTLNAQSSIQNSIINNQGANRSEDRGVTNRKHSLNNETSAPSREVQRSLMPVQGVVRQTTQASGINRDAPRATTLIVEPFLFLNLTQWDCVLEFNQHGTLKVSGLISEKNRKDYAKLITQETLVCAKALDEDGSEIILFRGVLTNLFVTSQHQFHTMTIEVKTESFLLDQMPKLQSYQNGNLSYSTVVKACLEPEGGWAIMREKEETTIETMLVRYKETSWDFIRRITKQLNLPLIPEIHTQGRRFYIGLDTTKKAAELVTNEYTSSSALGSFEDSYEVTHRQIYHLGQSVSFNGKKLIVSKVIRRLHGEELLNTYTLQTAPVAHQLTANQPRFNGLGLRASVTKVEKDQVQVTIHNDENKDNSGHRWFDFATVYSSPSGEGFYAMPSIGSEVLLVFPENQESTAYVANCVNLSTDKARLDPNHKSFKNDAGMELLMTLNEIIMRDAEGQSLELSSLKGITVNSNHAIDIRSDKQIQINAGEAINILGENEVNIQQKSSRINMKDDIKISGGKINLNS